MTKPVLVLGSRGMLGRAVIQWFSHAGMPAKGISRAEFDIASDPFEKLLPWLAESSAVLNCAGVIKPRIAAMKVEDVLRVNAIFPRNLARVCAQRGIPMFHVTTDCVFSGRKGSYDENDLFDAEDVYGMSKNAGEPGECMTLRTSIIGEEELGAGRSLLEWARANAGKQVNGFVNHRWNGVTTVQLAKTISALLEARRYQAGLFHVFSPEVVTKAELLELISRAYGLDLHVQPVDAKEACDRSLTSIHPLSRDLVTTPLARQLSEMRQLFAGGT